MTAIRCIRKGGGPLPDGRDVLDGDILLHGGCWLVRVGKTGNGGEDGGTEHRHPLLGADLGTRQIAPPCPVTHTLNC